MPEAGAPARAGAVRARGRGIDRRGPYTSGARSVVVQGHARRMSAIGRATRSVRTSVRARRSVARPSLRFGRHVARSPCSCGAAVCARISHRDVRHQVRGSRPEQDEGLVRDNLAAKTRVHELAKELGLTNKECLDLCLKLGIGVKTHSSGIEEAQADRVRRRAQRDGLVRDKQPEPTPAETAPATKAPAKQAPAKKAAAKKTAAKESAEAEAPAASAPTVAPAAETPASEPEPVAPAASAAPRPATPPPPPPPRPRPAPPPPPPPLPPRPPPPHPAPPPPPPGGGGPQKTPQPPPAGV